MPVRCKRWLGRTKDRCQARADLVHPKQSRRHGAPSLRSLEEKRKAEAIERDKIRSRDKAITLRMPRNEQNCRPV